MTSNKLPNPLNQPSTPSAAETFFKRARAFLDATSLLSFFSFGSVGSTFSNFSILALFGIGSILSVNAILSLLSVNSILSVLSANSILSIGCDGEFMKNCYVSANETA